MASFEMKNLKSFPMEKLCFDLKLEALEQMEPWDVYELVKVNQGFQGMLMRDPSIVFGEHVYWIRLFNETIWINKFLSSNEMKLNLDRLFFHCSFVKKIRSCDQLWLGSESKKTLERFFSNFHASIKKEALLNISWRASNDQVVKDQIENFLVAPQLKNCEKIWLDCVSEDSVRFYYNALLNSEIKNVYMRTDSWDWIDLIAQQIITNGIPSKNPEAAIFLGAYDFDLDLSQYPGMRRVDGENRLRLLEQANYLARNFGWSHSPWSGFFRKESSIFRRRFDSTKDCIYVYDERYARRFLAFYVPVD